MNIDFAALSNPEYLANLLLPVGLKLLAALAIFLIGWFVTKLLVHVLKRGMHRANREETLVDFMGTVLYTILMILVIIAALSQLGVKTTAAAAIVGGAALAIGLSLKAQLSSLAAGAMLIIIRPFRKGDYVEVAGVAGVVERVQLFSTTIITLNNQMITITNGDVWDNPITNYSILPTRRLDLHIQVDFDTDLKRAQAALRRVIANEPRVLKNPAPDVVVGEIGNEGIILWFRPWMKTSEFWPAVWAMNAAIRDELATEGIAITPPQMDVQLKREQQNPAPIRPAA